MVGNWAASLGTLAPQCTLQTLTSDPDVFTRRAFARKGFTI